METHSMDKPKVRLGTLRELFAFNDWARDAVMSCAVGLDRDRLDLSFEMGEGSLRKTLNHLYAAESVWLDRWENRKPHYRVSAEGVEMPRLWDEFRELAGRRNTFVDGLHVADLSAELTYTNIKGQTYTFPIGAMMLHVCNHGSHHRAQAVNMLRRVGAAIPKPGADYIFMKLENPGGTPSLLDADTIRLYFRYGDWAMERFFSTAATLSAEQLDHGFEIGIGTIRGTLAHIRDAEQWWLTNWINGPGALFPARDDRESIAEIASSFAETCAARNDILQTVTDEGLTRRVEATPRPGIVRNFPLGVTMLQLCHHGTHHRAQAVNMLRHVGAGTPSLDLLEMLKS